MFSRVGFKYFHKVNQMGHKLIICVAKDKHEGLPSVFYCRFLLDLYIFVCISQLVSSCHFVHVHVQCFHVVFSCVWPLRAACKQQTDLCVRELIPAEQRCSYKMSNQIPFPLIPRPHFLSLSHTTFLFNFHVPPVFCNQASLVCDSVSMYTLRCVSVYV